MRNPDFLNTICTEADLNETGTKPKDIICTASKSPLWVITLEVIDINGESLGNFAD
jgi:hypothetical protein